MEDSSRPTEKAETPPAKVWDSAFKWVGLLVAVLGAALAFGEYRTHQQATRLDREKFDSDVKEREQSKEKLARAELEQRHKEFRVKLYEAQEPLYRQACSAAAQVAVASKWEDAEAPARKFWELYYGELCLVESNEVVQAMIAYGATLRRCERDKKPHADLKKLSLDLAKACKDSLDLEGVFGAKDVQGTVQRKQKALDAN